MAVLRAEVVPEIACRGDLHFPFCLGPDSDARALDGDCRFEQVLADRYAIDDCPRVITCTVIRSDGPLVEKIQVIEFCLPGSDMQCGADCMRRRGQVIELGEGID